MSLQLLYASSSDDELNLTNVEDTRTLVQRIAGVLVTNKADYWDRLSHPHFYKTDGSANSNSDYTYIADGGNDIYDSGNFTEVFVGDNAHGTQSHVNSDCAILYNKTLRQDISNSNTKGTSSGSGAYAYACGGYTFTTSLGNKNDLGLPQIVVASAGSTTDSHQPKIGLMKSGNSGADGNSSSTKEKRTLYNGATVNGFTVYANDVTIHGNMDDPSTVDLYIALLHSNWNSSAGGATPTVEAPVTGFGTGNTANCESQFYFNSATQKNIVFIGMLLSEYNTGNNPNSPQPTTTELQNIIGDLTLDIKNDLGY